MGPDPSISAADHEEPRWLRAFLILEECEAKGIGQDWQVDGLHIWPMLKTLIVAPLLHSALEKTPSALKSKPTFLQRAGSVVGKSIAQLIFEKSPQTDLVNAILSDANSHKPLWCIGNTTPTLRGPLGLAHTHFDPYRLFAQSRGLDHWTLYYNEPANSPRVTDGLIGPNKGILKELSSTDFSPWRGEVERWKVSQGSFFDQFQSLHTDLRGLIRTCATAIARTLAYRSALRRIFDKRRPRVLLCFNYYQQTGWALCAAAREASIPLYDIQHGAESRFHHAYHWAKMPADGWNTTPQGYLLYGIPAGWDVSGAKCHVGAPSWYLWCRLAYAPDGDIALPTQWRKNAAHLLAGARELWAEAERRALPWHLYTSFPDEAPDRIDRIEASLKTRARVLRKRHPSAIRGDPSLLEKLPLPYTLAAMDGLVTHYSATILEAAAMNLPTFAFSGNAGKFYEGMAVRILPDSGDLAAAQLAAQDVNAAKPESRLIDAIAKTQWPLGWI